MPAAPAWQRTGLFLQFFDSRLFLLSCAADRRESEAGRCKGNKAMDDMSGVSVPSSSARSGWCSAAAAPRCWLPPFPALGIGFLGVAFAFGLTVLTMAYAVGHISGGHFNPAVTIGLWAAGRCANKHVVPYIVAQVVGAIVAAAVLWLIASGKPDWVPGGFAANGYGDLSPGKYGLACVLGDRGRDDVLLPVHHHRHDVEGRRRRGSPASRSAWR